MPASMAVIVTFLAMLFGYFATSHDTWPLSNTVRNFAATLSKLDSASARLDLHIQKNALRGSAILEVAYQCPLAIKGATPTELLDSKTADIGMFRFNWPSLLHMLSHLFSKEPTTASREPTREESVSSPSREPIEDSPSSKIIDLESEEFHQAQDVVREMDEIVVPSESTAEMMISEDSPSSKSEDSTLSNSEDSPSLDSENSPSSKIVDLESEEFHQAQDIVREMAEQQNDIVAPSESTGGDEVAPAGCKPEVQGEELSETSQDIFKHNIFEILEIKFPSALCVETQGVEEEMKSSDEIVPSEATTGHEVLPVDRGEELPGTSLAIINVQSNRGLTFINLPEWASKAASAVKNKWSKVDWTIGTWYKLDWTIGTWSKLDWTAEKWRTRLVLLVLIAVITASMQVGIFILMWPRSVESEPPSVNPGPSANQGYNEANRDRGKLERRFHHFK